MSRNGVVVSCVLLVLSVAGFVLWRQARSLQQVERRQQNEKKLAMCDPLFARRVQLVINDLEAAGYEPQVSITWRDSASQEWALAEGHSEATRSLHQNVSPEGLPAALAADITQLDGSPLEQRRFAVYLGCSAHRFGLATGIAWGLSGTDAEVIRQDVQNCDFNPKSQRLGWDPLHLQLAP